MKRTRFNNWPCPIARTIDRIGDAWTPIILRNALWGPVRFDELQRDLGIPRATLSDRLGRLEAEGIVEAVEYQSSPRRFEYHLTTKGHDLWPVMAAMWQWGSTYGWEEPKVPPFVMVDAETGDEVEPLMVDARTGRPLDPERIRVVPNPARPPHPNHQSQTYPSHIARGGTS